MPAPKLSPAQLLTLRAAADGKLWWSVVNNGYFVGSVRVTPSVRSLVKRGLLIGVRPVETAFGRALLATLDTEPEGQS